MDNSQQINNQEQQELYYIALGGVGEVTKNLHVYQLDNEILLVDCGLGFPNETMVGVDFLIPDISFLLNLLSKGKKIVGLVITHGHEDHMGALPFLLPQLPAFPIYATNFTSIIANSKLKSFGLPPVVKKTPFNSNIKIGNFNISFIQVTHSIPDTAHIFIKTPVGNFYHGSDFKFDLTPVDGKKSDFNAITRAGETGVTCLMSECLGASRSGYTPSEKTLETQFINEIRNAKGKFIVTTYSSNISRINQIGKIALSLNKVICFVGRSLIKTKDLARDNNLLEIPKDKEISIDQMKNYKDESILLFVAGSQGQDNSALTRIVNNEHRDVRIKKHDVVLFSADPIPGNELSVSGIIDLLSKMGVKVLYSNNDVSYHVSGHGCSQELMLLMSLLKPKNLLPISGSYSQMTSYRDLALKFGFSQNQIVNMTAGQEIIFNKNNTFKLGQKIILRQVYVDEVSGEEVEQFAVHDRQKIFQDGIVIIVAQIDGESGNFVGSPDVVSRGFSGKQEEEISALVINALKKAEKTHFQPRDWDYMRKYIREVAERAIFQKIRRRPLVMPSVIEV